MVSLFCLFFAEFTFAQFHSTNNDDDRDRHELSYSHHVDHFESYLWENHYGSNDGNWGGDSEGVLYEYITTNQEFQQRYRTENQIVIKHKPSTWWDKLWAASYNYSMY